MTKQKIKSVVEDGLCTGCGTCVALYPIEAVEHTTDKQRGIYLSRIDEGRCNDCGNCYEAFPGHSVDFRQLNWEIFGKEPEDILIENYLNCYA
jgi:coenzyme F420 hydrogenase subunit beta